MAEARAYAMRNRQGSDWFGHGDNGSTAAVSSPVKATPSSPPVAQNGAESTPSGRSQMIKPACNSNQWYKYDEKTSSAETTPKKDASKTKSSCQQSGDWYSQGTPSTDEKKDSKPRVVTSEGESYCRRDKAGSSATWFSHEHASEATPQGTGPRVTSKEGSGNASRMRGESENWFSHDANRANGASAPTHVSKGRGVQPKGNEMHHIFHMNTDEK